MQQQQTAYSFTDGQMLKLAITPPSSYPPECSDATVFWLAFALGQLLERVNLAGTATEVENELLALLSEQMQTAELVAAIRGQPLGSAPPWQHAVEPDDQGRPGMNSG